MEFKQMVMAGLITQEQLQDQFQLFHRYSLFFTF